MQICGKLTVKNTRQIAAQQNYLDKKLVEHRWFPENSEMPGRRNSVRIGERVKGWGQH